MSDSAVVKINQRVAQWRARVSLLAVLNGALLVIAGAGLAVMAISLTIAVGSIVKNHGALAEPRPAASASATQGFKLPVIKEVTRTYTFSKASDLKAFKKSGYGTLDISPGKRMRLRAEAPAAVSVSLCVGVDEGGTLSFDDEHSGDIDYDLATFSIDGMPYKNETGNAAGSAKYQVYELANGYHTFTWRYSTDNTFNLPSDAYYVDNLKLTKVIVHPERWLAGRCPAG